MECVLYRMCSLWNVFSIECVLYRMIIINSLSLSGVSLPPISLTVSPPLCVNVCVLVCVMGMAATGGLGV